MVCYSTINSNKKTSCWRFVKILNLHGSEPQKMFYHIYANFLNYLHGSEPLVVTQPQLLLFLNYLHGSEQHDVTTLICNQFLNYLHGSELITVLIGQL